MKIATLCFLVDKDKNRILLGMKKKGFGEGKYNGFGGKVEKNEKIEDAVKREFMEECGVKVLDVKNLARLNFVFKNKKEWDHLVHVFVSDKWEGTPRETSEMIPEWFDIEKIPFEKMWVDDKHWLPMVLSGKKFSANFLFEGTDTILDMKINHEL